MMKKLPNIFLIFLFNIVYNSFFIDFLFVKAGDSTTQQFFELVFSDLSKISFPISISISSNLIAVLISFLTTFILNSIIKEDLSNLSPVNFIKNLVKVFSSYLGTLFFILYLLRIYNLSRGLLLLSIFIYPLLFVLYLTLINKISKISLKSVKILFILLVIFSGIFFFNSNSEKVISSEFDVKTRTTIKPSFGKIEITCKEWLGSDNFESCLDGAEVNLFKSFEKKISNLIYFNNQIYVLQIDGLIYNLDDQNIFIDLTDRVGVLEEFFETGLYSMAFSPKNDFVLISYSDTNNNLIIEKFYLNVDNWPEKNTSEILLKIPNSQCCHFSGNIIWSNYFEDFLISVGDMQSKEGTLHSNPLDTTSPKGKILFLNKKISRPDLLSLEKNGIVREDILAYGMRNPWKTYEYNGLLFVPDVGNSLEEELNLINLDEFYLNNNKPFLFGWPYFEGTIDRGVRYNEINLHNNEGTQSINKYIWENSLSPIVHYKHNAPENYRSAIIGGGVIQDSASTYFETYIFADYLSNEIFIFDFKNNKLKLLPIGNLETNITSLLIDPNEFNTIILSTNSGNIFKVKLP